MVTAKKVANLFLAWANEDGDLITNLKLQKLLYYAQAWHLVFFDEPLFSDSMEAWDWGPVVTTLYHEYKKYRYGAIVYKNNGNEKNNFTPDQMEYLKAFYNKFIGYSAHELVNMTHNETPWENASKQRGNKKISLNSMKTYYSSLQE